MKINSFFFHFIGKSDTCPCTEYCLQRFGCDQRNFCILVTRDIWTQAAWHIGWRRKRFRNEIWKRMPRASEGKTDKVTIQMLMIWLIPIKKKLLVLNTYKQIKKNFQKSTNDLLSTVVFPRKTFCKKVKRFWNFNK